MTSVAFRHDGHRIASGGNYQDDTVRLWDADTGKPIGAPLTGPTNGVTSVAFSPDDTRIASGSYDNTVRLWNADTGKPIGAPLTGRTSIVLSVAFSPDGNHRLRRRRRHGAAVARFPQRRVVVVRQAPDQHEPPTVARMGVAYPD